MDCWCVYIFTFLAPPVRSLSRRLAHLPLIIKVMLRYQTIQIMVMLRSVPLTFYPATSANRLLHLHHLPRLSNIRGLPVTYE